VASESECGGTSQSYDQDIQKTPFEYGPSLLHGPLEGGPEQSIAEPNTSNPSSYAAKESSTVL